MVTKKNKSNLKLQSMFSDKPILKNGYVMALLVFLALVVAFNVADQYASYDGNQVTGYAIGDSFGKITDLLRTMIDFVFRDILESTVFGSFLLYNDIIIRLFIFIVVYGVVSLAAGWKKWGDSPAHKKNIKIISALVAIATAVFTPFDVIIGIFGSPNAPGLFGGTIGLIFWGAVIYIPLVYLFRKLGKSDERFLNIIYGVIFLGIIFVIGAIEGRVSINSELRDLWDLLLSLAILSCFVGFFWGVVVKGLFKGASKLSVERGAETLGKVAGYDVLKPFKEFGGAYSEASGKNARKNEERENLVKLDRLAKAYAHSILKRNSISDRVKITSKFVQQAKKLGFSKREAEKFLNRYIK